MKLAVISDVKGNKTALDKVLSILVDRRVDHIISLGNIVGQCQSPNYCVEVSEGFHTSLLGPSDKHMLTDIDADLFEHAPINRILLEESKKDLSMRNISILKQRNSTACVFNLMFYSGLVNSFRDADRTKPCFCWANSHIIIKDRHRDTPGGEGVSPMDNFRTWKQIGNSLLSPGRITALSNLGISEFCIVSEKGVFFETTRYDYQPFIDYYKSVPGIPEASVQLRERVALRSLKQQVTIE